MAGKTSPRITAAQDVRAGGRGWGRGRSGWGVRRWANSKLNMGSVELKNPSMWISQRKTALNGYEMYAKNRQETNQKQENKDTGGCYSQESSKRGGGSHSAPHLLQCRLCRHMMLWLSSPPNRVFARGGWGRWRHCEEPKSLFSTRWSRYRMCTVWKWFYGTCPPEETDKESEVLVHRWTPEQWRRVRTTRF